MPPFAPCAICVRIRSFGFLANRHRATLLSLCQRLLLDHPRPATPPTNTPRPPACFRCPQCSTPMVRVESLSAWDATQLLHQRIQLDSSSMASHITPHHGIIDSDGLGVFRPLRCCGPVTHFCLQTTPEHSLLPAELQPIFTYYSTFASPWAKDLRIGKAKPIAPPRPPQTPAASAKSPYRKCAGGIHLWTHAAARRRRICDRELRFFNKDPHYGGNAPPQEVLLTIRAEHV